jgi:hypothetical protein
MQFISINIKKGCYVCLSVHNIQKISEQIVTNMEENIIIVIIRGGKTGMTRRAGPFDPLFLAG